MRYIIKDWASNVLQYSGKFNFSSYGANTGTPYIFASFDDAWDYILQNIPEDSHDDLFVEELV
jgi:hypothetical protein